MSRTTRTVVLPLVTAAVLLLAACGSGTQAAGGDANSHAAMQSKGLPGEHIHAVARDPGDGKIYLATHQGLFRYDKTGPVRIGPLVDFMGFSIAGPGHFYSSGHPGAGADLPQPVGLMESRDSGITWSVQSRGGKSDFHALTSSGKGVLGYDGVLSSTVDGKVWKQRAIPSEPHSLAASPDGARVLATTPSGLLLSRDQGATWAPIPAAPQLLLVAWADNATATGVTRTGALAVTTNAGATWTTGKATVDSAQALGATRKKDGALEVLVVTDTEIKQSIDSGATFATSMPH